MSIEIMIKAIVITVLLRLIYGIIKVNYKAKILEYRMIKLFSKMCNKYNITDKYLQKILYKCIKMRYHAYGDLNESDIIKTYIEVNKLIREKQDEV